jgi:hypothetical protein
MVGAWHPSIFMSRNRLTEKVLALVLIRPHPRGSSAVPP